MDFNKIFKDTLELNKNSCCCNCEVLDVTEEYFGSVLELILTGIVVRLSMQ